MKPEDPRQHTAHQPGNLLANANSPYLLQHARNPVHWHPWGEPAFERARAEEKPVFLSIGYSACHWCHVMAHESFENPQTAQLLNAHFVSVKVDREERPDVDTVYMQAVQAMTGSGGWPLSVFLTPDKKPFYGGTYFPHEPRYGMPSFQQVLLGIARAWEDNRGEVTEQADVLANAVRQDLGHAPSPSSDTPNASTLDAAFKRLRERYDATWGGFSPAPKFPSAATIAFLLRHHVRTGNPQALEMAETTLDRMACGGIYDRIGGGFHRYATDAQWLVPHFEKMLCDNALLAMAYTDAWQLTRNALYKRIARDTLGYLLREMTDEAGGFHSAEDADSEGREGLYYLWTTGEIARAVGPEDARLAMELFGATDEGNFEGSNILHLPQSLQDFARDHDLQLDELLTRHARWTETLRKARASRIRPERDDKILAAWNGMAISALARASQAFADPMFGLAAERAAEFILSNMVRHGKLMRTWRHGKPGPQGYLDDYAHLTLALLDLYEATFDTRWLGSAERLAETMADVFRDPEGDGFLYAGKDHERLIARSKPGFDGATPSGNSVAAMALLRLGQLLDRDDWREMGEGVFRAFGKDIDQAPTAFLDMLAALDFHLHPGPEIVVAGNPDGSETRALLELVNSRYLPNRMLAHLPSNPPPADASAPAEAWLEHRETPETGARAWVCRNFACEAPADSPEALAKALDIPRSRAVWSRSEEQ